MCVCVCVCVCVLCKKCSTLFVVEVITVRSGQERVQWLVEFESVDGLVLGKEDKRSVLCRGGGGDTLANSSPFPRTRPQLWPSELDCLPVTGNKTQNESEHVFDDNIFV